MACHHTATTGCRGIVDARTYRLNVTPVATETVTAVASPVGKTIADAVCTTVDRKARIHTRLCVAANDELGQHDVSIPCVRVEQLQLHPSCGHRVERQPHVVLTVCCHFVRNDLQSVHRVHVANLLKCRPLRAKPNHIIVRVEQRAPANHVVSAINPADHINLVHHRALR